MTSSRLGGPASTLLVLAACTCLGALIAVGVREVIQRDVSEQALIGLTTESEWPFHEAHISATAGALDAELVEQVQLDLGQPIDTSAVRLDRQRQDISGVLTVTAVGSSSERAAALANEVAQRMVDEVQPETPVRLLDPADGNAEAASTRAALIGGAIVGLVLGLTALSLAGSRSVERTRRQR